jgi:hypothetical protein
MTSGSTCNVCLTLSTQRFISLSNVFSYMGKLFCNVFLTTLQRTHMNSSYSYPACPAQHDNVFFTFSPNNFTSHTQRTLYDSC